MSNFGALYFPASDARELNKKFRETHLAFLREEPYWCPPEVSWVPQCIIRALNRLAARMPFTAPLGWLDGRIPADDAERQRIRSLPDEEQKIAIDLHERAIYGRCFRIGRPSFADATPSPPAVDGGNSGNPS